MRDYDFKSIENKWRKRWEEQGTYRVNEDSTKEKLYVLDMFPYPSGAGLHVGHPLGYIASDIYSRFKKLNGFNVLHPMGYDAFGLPAEQYAIQTGQHPAVTTEQNLKRYREQLDLIGFSFDWSREVKTSDPSYYKWTQWVFLQLFDSWFNNNTGKAERIESLVKEFETNGSMQVDAANDCETEFTAEEWEAFSEVKQQELLLDYRLTYISNSVVNWCPALGTVLANDEIKDGVSERGGHPVEQRKMRQWSMRISAYAERLLQGLEELDWSDSLKEIQRNWIGKSTGASIFFEVEGSSEKLEVFTTRPDTIFGASFMVLAPEHELVSEITTDAQKAEIDAYIEQAKAKTERDRMANVKNVTGAFTGAYAKHPFSGENIPIWIADYVLASYGTGAVMAVPSGDQRDWDFAKVFDLPIVAVIEGTDVSEGANNDKNGVLCNSDFLNGMKVKKAISRMIHELEQKGIGTKQTNYKMRDAVFSRQRYWGEPVPMYFKDGAPYPIPENCLPLVLPEVDKYLPTEDGDPPLGNAKTWAWNEAEQQVVATDLVDNQTVFPLELNTMPGWAGSSWYYLRYMDANNNKEFVDASKVDYWQNVDLYLGGAEHATGHLLYFRFWTKVLNDLGYLPFDEPAKRLINQGMIGGPSIRIAGQHGKRDSNIPDLFLPKETYSEMKKESFNLENPYERLKAFNQDLSDKIDFWKGSSAVWHSNNYYDISLLKDENTGEIDLELLKAKYPDATILVGEDGKLKGQVMFEKMSKSKLNTINPDDIIARYGADTMRLYEMFLGPIEQHKPWKLKGIEGPHNFLKKFWRLVHDQEGNFVVIDEKPNKEEYKALHKAIKKVTEDNERFSFNTVVSTFMVAVNELGALKCNKREIIEQLIILMQPHCPFITEEIWEKLGHNNSITKTTWPVFDESHLVENSFAYPVSFNGKMRFKLELPLSLSKDEVEKAVLENEQSAKYIDGKPLKKVIVVPGRIVNIVV